MTNKTRTILAICLLMAIVIVTAVYVITIDQKVELHGLRSNAPLREILQSIRETETSTTPGAEAIVPADNTPYKTSK